MSLRAWRKLAQNNRLANLRLLTACKGLRPGEFEARRVSFFPSLKMTLNHILTVDWFYVDALEGGSLGARAWENEEPFGEIFALAEAQAAVDQRLLAFCTALTETSAGGATHIHRASGIQTHRTQDVLMHLFMHQTHHRGQVHAMLSGSSVPPPQLDEFILSGDALFRTAEMAALGWSEDELMG